MAAQSRATVEVTRPAAADTAENRQFHLVTGKWLRSDTISWNIFANVNSVLIVSSDLVDCQPQHGESQQPTSVVAQQQSQQQQQQSQMPQQGQQKQRPNNKDRKKKKVKGAVTTQLAAPKADPAAAVATCDAGSAGGGVNIAATGGNTKGDSDVIVNGCKNSGHSTD